MVNSSSYYPAEPDDSAATPPLPPVVDVFCQLYLHDKMQTFTRRETFRDRDSLAAWPSRDVLSHLFAKDQDRANRYAVASDLDRWLDNLDAHGIERAGVPLLPDTPPEILERLASTEGRIFGVLVTDPHQGMEGVRAVGKVAETYPFIRGISVAPHQLYPAAPPSSKEYYPLYAKAVELDLPVSINVGMPGPRLPGECQRPIHLDEVCWFFPDLKVVMRHGGLPWVDECIRMMDTWPNLYYSTTALTPRHYPRQVLDYLKTRRGRSKIIFGGYFPTLSYEKVLGELAGLDLPREAFQAFVHDNAWSVFGLDRLGDS